MTDPMVTGRFDRSLADFERACLVHLDEEQQRANPDNALIAVLCDAVRLAREQAPALLSLPGPQARSEFRCQARAATTDPPQDCDWPFCGCDPYADKVLVAIEDSGRLSSVKSSGGPQARSPQEPNKEQK